MLLTLVDALCIWICSNNSSTVYRVLVVDSNGASVNSATVYCEMLTIVTRTCLEGQFRIEMVYDITIFWVGSRKYGDRVLKPTSIAHSAFCYCLRYYYLATLSQPFPVACLPYLISFCRPLPMNDSFQFWYDSRRYQVQEPLPFDFTRFQKYLMSKVVGYLEQGVVGTCLGFVTYFGSVINAVSSFSAEKIAASNFGLGFWNIALRQW